MRDTLWDLLFVLVFVAVFAAVIGWVGLAAFTRIMG